jgi:microcystin-dependent protein
MTVEAAIYIDTLNSSLPPSNDPKSEGDDHLRLIKQVLKATFPNIKGPVTVNEATINNATPVGIICMWSGATPPTGWTLCDGVQVPRSDGTGNITPPDLRNKFVIAAGATYALNTTGGAASVTLSAAQMPVHNHGASGSADVQGNHAHNGSTDGQGNHQHTLPNSGSVQAGSDNGGAQSPVATGYGSGRGQNPTDYGGYHSHNISTDAQGNHSHNISVSIGNAGSGQPFNIIPPYYAIAYIMKI